MIRVRKSSDECEAYPPGEANAYYASMTSSYSAECHNTFAISKDNVVEREKSQHESDKCAL